MKAWTRILLTIAGMLITTAVSATVVQIKPYTTQDFNPSSGKTFALPISIDQPGTLAVTLYTADGDLVRTLLAGKKDQAGTYKVIWDGRDEHNTIVPNEAYVPVVTLATSTGVHTYDPRAESGGEELKITPHLDDEGRITFKLENPSRVLVRAGIQSGPLLKTIAQWEVRGKGRNIIQWDGYDHDDLIPLINHEQLALLVTGFELPTHSILTIGNTTLAYQPWRKKNAWPSTMPDLGQVEFARGEHRISRHYYLPRSLDIEPRVTLTIVDKLPLNQEGLPIVTGPLTLKVDMHEEDRWAMQQSLYEVAFFIDNTFLSEEEQGYVPLTWRWNPAGLKPGIHLVTVNVSGFNGQVGVKSLQIEVRP